LAIRIADFLIWSKKHLPFVFKPLFKLASPILKILFLPFVLLIYKNVVLLKIKLKNRRIKDTALLLFIKKYLAGTIVVLIIVGTSTSNIFAQNYSTDEYAQKTLLSTIVKNDSATWSEVIEEKAPVNRQAPALGYLSNQDTLQEPLTNNNTNSASGESIGLSADATSLVVINSDEDSLEIPVPTRSENVDYFVQAGDTLSGIAEKFDLTVNTILWANNLTWNSTIKPGAKLVILPSSGVDYEIKKGDNLNSVAKKYQANLDKILAYNELSSVSDIRAGDLIFIPEGIKPTQVVSSYKAPTVANKPKNNPADVFSNEVVPPASDLSANTKLLWPVLSHRITQYFSWRHTGLDVGDKVGNPIYASEDGKIERSGWSTGYGYNVIINHGNGLETLYGHASKLLVKTGETVSRGQVIALIGSTGWSTGPHLHMEVRVNGVRKNPISYIK
jgi:murein DD-endopeptidase MepM/ murein hydrolase activator NlpD